MTPDEREAFYDRTTTLARLWIVLDVLGDVCPSAANGLKKDEWSRTLKWVSGHVEKLKRMIDDSGDDQEQGE